MREYGQYCAVAKALDVVGDRWTLLIVRELSIRPCRYTDLRDGLPGIATNLLADRLRTLEAAGVIAAQAAAPPVATTVYHLTDRGRGLLPAIGALARWAAPQMGDRVDSDEFRPRWLVAAARASFEEVDDAGDLAPLVVTFDVAGEAITLLVEDGRVGAELGASEAPDLHVACAADDAFRLLTGALTLDDAAGRGARVAGVRRARQNWRRLVERARDLPARR